MPRFCLSVIFALIAPLGLADFAWADASAVSISGNVVASGSAAPISGATITVFRYGILSFQPAGTTTTDANGNYLVEGLELEPPSSFYVQADAGDYWIVQEWPGAECPPVPGFCGPIGSHVPVVAGQVSAGVNFSLNAGGVIQGHVKRSDTQAPVADAALAPFSGATTDANGAYRLRSVAPAEHVLSAGAGGLITTFNDGQQCDDFHSCEDIVAQPFIVAASATTTVDIALAPGVMISGLVFVDGSPDTPRPAVLLYNESDPQRPHINGSSLEYPPLPHDYVFRNLIARTYTVRFVDPSDSRYISEYYNNVACDQPLCDGVAQFVTVSGQQITGIDATVSPRQKVIGRVVDAVSQTPLMSAHVQALVVQGFIYLYWETIAETHSDAAGNFTLVGIPAATAFALRFNAADHLGVQTPDVICDDINSFCDSLNTYAPPHSVVANTTLDVGDIALSRGATISGHVTNLETGQGLPDSQVDLYLDGGGSFTSYFTDSDGNYSTRVLRAASFKAVASTPYESQMYDHVDCPDAYSCDIALATPITVSGSATFPGIDFSLHDPDVVFSSGFDN